MSTSLLEPDKTVVKSNYSTNDTNEGL